jgi:hypothetical protein
MKSKSTRNPKVTTLEKTKWTTVEISMITKDLNLRVGRALLKRRRKSGKRMNLKLSAVF